MEYIKAAHLSHTLHLLTRHTHNDDQKTKGSGLVFCSVRPASMCRAWESDAEQHCLCVRVLFNAFNKLFFILMTSNGLLSAASLNELLYVTSKLFRHKYGTIGHFDFTQL